MVGLTCLGICLNAFSKNIEYKALDRDTKTTPNYTLGMSYKGMDTVYPIKPIETDAALVAESWTSGGKNHYQLQVVGQTNKNYGSWDLIDANGQFERYCDFGAKNSNYIYERGFTIDPNDTQNATIVQFVSEKKVNPNTSARKLLEIQTCQLPIVEGYDNYDRKPIYKFDKDKSTITSFDVAKYGLHRSTFVGTNFQGSDNRRYVPISISGNYLVVATTNQQIAVFDRRDGSLRDVNITHPTFKSPNQQPVDVLKTVTIPKIGQLVIATQRPGYINIVEIDDGGHIVNKPTNSTFVSNTNWSISEKIDIDNLSLDKKPTISSIEVTSFRDANAEDNILKDESIGLAFYYNCGWSGKHCVISYEGRQGAYYVPLRISPSGKISFDKKSFPISTNNQLQDSLGTSYFKENYTFGMVYNITTAPKPKNEQDIGSSASQIDTRTMVLHYYAGKAPSPNPTAYYGELGGFSMRNPISSGVNVSNEISNCIPYGLIFGTPPVSSNVNFSDVPTHKYFINYKTSQDTSKESSFSQSNGVTFSKSTSAPTGVPPLVKASVEFNESTTSTQNKTISYQSNTKYGVDKQKGWDTGMLLCVQPSYIAMVFEVDSIDGRTTKYINDPDTITPMKMSFVYPKSLSYKTYYFKLSDPTMVWKDSAKEWVRDNTLAGLPKLPATNDLEEWKTVDLIHKWDADSSHDDVEVLKSNYDTAATSSEVSASILNSDEFSYEFSAATEIDILGMFKQTSKVAFSNQTKLTKGSGWGMNYEVLNTDRKNYSGQFVSIIPTKRAADKLEWTSNKMKRDGVKPWVVFYNIQSGYN